MESSSLPLKVAIVVFNGRADSASSVPIYMLPINKNMNFYDYSIFFPSVLGADIIYIISDGMVMNYILSAKGEYIFDYSFVFENFKNYNFYLNFLKKNYSLIDFEKIKVFEIKVIPTIIFPVFCAYDVKSEVAENKNIFYYFYYMSLINEIIKTLSDFEVQYMLYDTNVFFDYFEVIGLENGMWSREILKELRSIWSGGCFESGGVFNLNGRCLPFVISRDVLENIMTMISANEEQSKIKDYFNASVMSGINIRINKVSVANSFFEFYNIFSGEIVRSIAEKYCNLYYKPNNKKKEKFKIVYFLDFLRGGK